MSKKEHDDDDDDDVDDVDDGDGDGHGHRRDIIRVNAPKIIWTQNLNILQGRYGSEGIRSKES